MKAAKKNELEKLKTEVNNAQDYALRLSEFVHDRKQSYFETQGHQKDSLMNDLKCIRNMEQTLHQINKKDTMLSSKTQHINRQ